MLRELLRHDNLGDSREIGFVLFQAITPTNQNRLDALRMFCISNIFAMSRSIDGILELLQFLSIIRLDYLTVSLNHAVFDPRDYSSAEDYFELPNFYDLLFKTLSQTEEGRHFFNENNLKFNGELNQYYVQSHMISFELYPIRNLLLRMSFLQPDSNIKDHLFVAPAFTGFFKETIADSLVFKLPKHRFTLEQLKSSLLRRDEVGQDGEMAVIQYEQGRLKGHLQLSQIRQISEEYVNAGYDIVSFDNIDSFINDRFIEVKTYTHEIAFYWSKQEVEVARRLQNKYWLYLVDSKRMNIAGYVPKMIQDPYRKIFENEEWKKETEKWKIFIED